MNNLYTVVDRVGAIIEAHVEVEAAARAILTYDGAEYTITSTGEGWSLYTKRLNWLYDPNHPVEYSAEHDYDAAAAEIFRRVVERADTSAGWKAEAIADEDYEASLRLAIEDAAERGDDAERAQFQTELEDWRAMK